MAKLKVYRTPIGFHDAYVAATSQKAALAAWGSERDLFARGVAEVVTDAALAAEPLAHPGAVIKRSRGTAAEQIAALPPDAGRPSRRKGEAPAAPDDPPKPAAVRHAPAPKPSRTALTEAERALAQAEARHRSEDRALRADEAALARRRRAMEQAHREDCATLDAARQAAAQAYDAAVRRWRG